MAIIERDYRSQAAAAVRGFQRTVLEPGLFTINRTPTPKTSPEPTVIVIEPEKAVVTPTEQKLLPPVSTTTPTLVTKKEPRELSGEWAEMAAAIQGYEERQKLTYEEKVRADALISRAFHFSLTMNGRSSDLG